MRSQDKSKGPCPSCVLRDHYNRDGAFAATIDYQHEPDFFRVQVQGTIEYILANKFEDGVGVRIKQKRGKQYIKTALGLIGCPDVAEIMDKDANEAKRILQHRFTDLTDWDTKHPKCNETQSKRITETLRRWQKHAPEYSPQSLSAKSALQLVK